MAALAGVDSGPMYAAADFDDRAHAYCVEVLRRPDLVITPDRRHFGALAPRHVPAHRLPPDPA